MEPVAPRSGKALTAAQVRSALTPGKHHDGGGLGLYLRVEANGARFWVQRITIHGKRCELGLGSPPTVSLAEARDIAFSNRKMARAGGDPLRAKKEATAVLTFEEAARKVHALHKPTWRNEKHAAQFLSTLETYAFPRIGRLKTADVSTADVLAVLSPIWTAKAETARRVQQRIGMVMKWAVAQGWRQDNPAAAISEALPKLDRQKVQRKALPFVDVSECLKAVLSSEAGLSTKLAFEFLILTACRSGEVRGALPSEIDWDAQGGPVWNIPASRMKAKRPHTVPLSLRSAEIVRAAVALGGPFLFPGTRKGKGLSDATLLKLVRDLGYDIDIHGFRTSFRTWAQERTNFPREVAESALAHTIKDKSEAAYARSDLIEKRRKMMAAWAGFVARNDAKIVSISGAGR